MVGSAAGGASATDAPVASARAGSSTVSGTSPGKTAVVSPTAAGAVAASSTKSPQNIKLPTLKRARRAVGSSAADALWARTLSGASAPAWKRHCARARFSAFRLAQSHDTHDPDAANLKLSFLRRRSKIVEIVSAGDVVFALTLSGVCAAFRGPKRLAFLNTTPDEVIRSLFYNKISKSLITVSVYREDNFASLKCRNTPIEYILRGRPDAGFPIFTTECLKWPGFVEFDDVNSKVLTYSAQDQAFRVWGMVNYEHLYTIQGDDVTEIKISPGIMLLIHSRQGGYVPLKIVSIEDGTVLKSFNHLLHRTKKVEFIEQFNEKLLIKQEGENLHIVDVHTHAVVSVDKTEFITPSAFVFLYENNLFLTFRQRQVMLWNFKGEQVTTFEDHMLWHPETNTNNFFITAAQDYIISYCRPRGSTTTGGGLLALEDEPPKGTVHISHILTGKCVARLSRNSSRSGSSSRSSGSDAAGMSFADDSDGEEATSIAARTDGLGDVTALHYSEERNELFVGDRQGILHVWS